AKRRPAAAGQDSTITELLRRAERPLQFDELAARMGVAAAAPRKHLQEDLERLLHTGQLVRNRRDEYCLREKLALIVGTVSGHRDGHGILQPDDRSAPVFLPHRQMRDVMHGDRVAVRVTGKDSRGRPEGSVVDVLERGTSEIVGRLYDESGIALVVPDNPRI